MSGGTLAVFVNYFLKMLSPFLIDYGRIVKFVMDLVHPKNFNNDICVNLCWIATQSDVS